MRAAIVAWVIAVGSSGCGAPHEAAAPVSGAVDREIIEGSHALLAAFDRGDVAAVTPMLGDHYVHFETKAVDAKAELANVAQAARDAASGVGLRTWSDEAVFVRPHDAIFVGKAVEHQAGNASHGGGYVFEGYYTLGWSRDDGGAWRVVFLAWRPAGSVSEATSWNQIYHHATGFEHAPNKLLAEVATTHAPGTAMDVAMGQGRNAIYLATQGWHVTGVDIADEGITQARAEAAKRGVAIDAVTADVTTFDYGIERYDLIAMIYAYPAIKKIPDLQAATKHGGLFVYEFFAPDGSPGDDAPAPGALAKQFAGWDILRDDIVDGIPDWRTDHAKLQRFVARKR